MTMKWKKGETKEKQMVDIILENEQDKEEITSEIRQAVERVCEIALKTEECDFDAQISITFVDNETIREINRSQRNINSATDVLSFPMLEFDENGVADIEYEMDGDMVVLGDIVISAQRAREQAEEYGHSLVREIAFLTAHSMLHLLGYDHVGSKDDEEIMCEKQENILNTVGITRDYGREI